MTRRSNDQLITVKAPATSTKMDPEIWSRLPEVILEHVLSFLPFITFWNLRSTCKHFNSLVFSPSFMSKYSSSSSPSSSSPFSSYLLLSHPHFYNHFPLYNSALGTWRILDISLSNLLRCAAQSFSLVSTSKGLFCVSLPKSSSFLVCNLLARTSRIIKFPSRPFAFELPTLVSTPAGYKLFLLSSGSSPNSAFLYDSTAHSWRQFDGFEPILSDNYHQGGVCFNGSLYFTTPEPFSVVCFDLESGKWERSNSVLPRELTFVRLVSGGDGKLYLIGGVGGNGISRSVKMWELGEERNWVEVERLPEMMCRKFVSVCYHNYEHVYCFWHQGMICLCCYTWPEILYYKVSRKTWHWLPKCPSLPEKWSCGFRWFSFVPELNSLV